MSLGDRVIELWVEARDGQPAVNPIMQGLLAELEAAGATTVVRVPEHDIVDIESLFQGGRPDLVLLKSATTLALSLATVIEAAGVPILNDVHATMNAHDKAATIARLAAAGLPVPITFLGASASLRPDELPATDDLWVAKPVRGIHGQGVSMHGSIQAAVKHLASPIRLEGFVVDDGTRLIQQLVGEQGEPDVKVYVAGETLFAGAKTFSSTSFANNQIAERRLDDHTATIVRAAGPALGLRCYGVDLRIEDDMPYIIDANPFPGYRGFPAAIPALLAEIERALEHVS